MTAPGRRAIACGSRHWTDVEHIRRVLAGLHSALPFALVVHGDAEGADRIAGDIAGELGIPVKAVPAEWPRWGRSAGPRRNAAMLDIGVDVVICFHDDLLRSRGSGNMVRQASA